MKVLYTDIDGTLTREGSLLHGVDGPSTAAAEGLVRLLEAGVEVVPVSGRAVADLAPFARAIGARSFVAELGAVVALDGGAREVRTYDAPPARAVLESSGAVDRVLAAFPGRLERHAPWSERRAHSVLLRGAVEPAEVARRLPEGFVCVDNGPIGRPEGSKLDVDEVHAYHLAREGVDKPAGVRFDLARRGLDPRSAAFVGDSEGDAAMVGVVGRVVLLGVHREGALHVAARYGEGFREAARMLLGDGA